MTNLNITLLFLCIYGYLGMVATYQVIVSDTYERKQKIIQIIISWLVPILGATLVIVFALSEKEISANKTEENKVNSVLHGIPSAIFGIITLSAFAGSVGGATPDNGDGGELSSFDGSDGAGGDGDGGGSDG